MNDNFSYIRFVYESLRAEYYVIEYRFVDDDASPVSRERVMIVDPRNIDKPFTSITFSRQFAASLFSIIATRKYALTKLHHRRVYFILSTGTVSFVGSNE